MRLHKLILQVNLLFSVKAEEKSTNVANGNNTELATELLEILLCFHAQFSK